MRAPHLRFDHLTLLPSTAQHRYSLVVVPLIGVLLLGLAMLSFRVAVASPTLSVQSVAAPGGAVVVSGDGFEPDAHIELRWDGSTEGMPVAHADAAGHFVKVVTIPHDAAAGTYDLTAVGHASNGEGQGAATLTVRVVTTADGSKHIAATEQDPMPTATPELTILPVARDPGHAGHDVEAPAPSDQQTLAHANPDAANPADSGHAPGTGHGSAPASPPPAPHAGGHAPASGNPVNCTGYPEPRVFLEVHTWWEGAPLAAGQIAHLHTGTCFPLGQTVSGQVAFDVRVVMHDNPGHLYRYETGLHTEGRGEGDLPVIGLDHRCATTCEFWVRSVVDTSRANDGFHEFRFKSRVRHSNGEVQLTSSGWPLRTENGNPDGGFRDEGGAPWLDVVGRGWYDGHGYQNPVLRTVDGVLPGQVVAGVWTPTLRLDAGSEGEPTTFAAAYVDPEFHFNDEDSTGGGVVLGTWAGEFRGPLAIDTRGLANGQHTLVLRVDAAHNGTRLVGLQYVPFIVNN